MTPSRQKPDGSSALQRAPNLILTNSLFGQKPLPSVVPDAIRPIETTRVLVANRRDDSGVAARGARAAVRSGADGRKRCAGPNTHRRIQGESFIRWAGRRSGSHR